MFKASPQQRHLRRRRAWASVVLLLVAAAAAALPCGLSAVGHTLTAAHQDGLGGIVAEVNSALRPLQEQIDSGHVVAKYGEKAQGILLAAVQRAGAAGPQLHRAIDAMLQSLFLRQLAILRKHTAANFLKIGSLRALEAMMQADTQFVSQAEELKRPGSSWSFEQERYALRAVLQGSFEREAWLLEEKDLAALAQQSTTEVIGRLQAQMESLQQKVQHLRAGSPWFLSSTYRIPGTPLSLIGRYQQGRANIEINLSPDRDPVNAQAGFVEGFGPGNLGAGLTLAI